jgi:hypothetical protein
MKVAIEFKHSHAAALMLKIMAESWNTAVCADAIYMPHLIELLKAFPTLAVPFLADQIKLVQVAKPFYLNSRDVASFRSKWVRAATSLQTVSASNWDALIRELLATVTLKVI